MGSGGEGLDVNLHIAAGFSLPRWRESRDDNAMLCDVWLDPDAMPAKVFLWESRGTCCRFHAHLIFMDGFCPASCLSEWQLGQQTAREYNHM